MVHDPKIWHPHDGTHHHGYDPKAFLPIFGAPLQNHLNTYGEIGYPWATSPTEEHEGYIWLYTAAKPGGELFKLPKGTHHYVMHALIQIHATGTMHHFRKRFHSFQAFLVTEHMTTKERGVVMTGGWTDYGICHAPYKAWHYKIPGVDPVGFTNINTSPYRATQTRYDMDGFLVHFWSGLKPQPVAAKYFPEKPQNILGLTWSTHDAKEYPGITTVVDESQDKTAVLDGNRKFQLFTVMLQNLPVAPFNGFTNRYGHITTLLGEVGVDKVPLSVSAGVPVGTFILNRDIKHGDPNAAPVMEF